MGSTRKRRPAAGIVLILGLLVTGCSDHSHPSPSPPSLPTRSSPTPSLPQHSSGAQSQPRGSPSASATTGGLDHVVIIVEENKSAAGIIGNSAAPYLNKLAAEFALADDYHAVTHPSLPNYLALTSGTTAGITTDCSPGGGCEARVPNIADEIEKSGRSWKMYAESMPGPCVAGNSGTYAVKHNPFLYYPSVYDPSGAANNARCTAHDVPFTQFSADLKTRSTLPDYVFISPDLCNDMHDCSVQTGDTWLSRQVPKILTSPAFTRQRSLLVITWDEDSGGSNRVSTIFAGSAAKKGYKSEVRYGHYSLLHTIESAWGLTPLTTNDKNAPVMSEFLR